MEKHTHQYVRIKIGKNKRIEFKCSVDGCVHHIRPELAIGRNSICYRCGNTFVLDKANMQLARPHCDVCTDSPKVNEVKTIAQILTSKGL